MNDFMYTFLMIGYLFKPHFYCAPSNSLGIDSTLSEAIEFCNRHSDCNCVEFSRTSGSYFSQLYNIKYDKRTQVSDRNYDSWVISFLSNQTIDRIIQWNAFLSYIILIILSLIVFI